MALLIPLVLICSVLLLFIGKYHFSRRHLYKHARSIPGLPGTLPILGDALRFNTDDLWKAIEIVRDFYDEEGLFKIWLGNKFFISVTDPECARLVFNNYLEKGDFYNFLKPTIGEGLFAAEVPIWKQHRKFISPTLCQRNLNEFAETFIEQSEVLVEKLSNKIGKEEFDVLHDLLQCSMNMVCQTIIGVDMNIQEKEKNSFLDSVVKGQKLFNIRVISPWLHPEFVFYSTKYGKVAKDLAICVNSFLENIVNKKLSNARKTKDQYEDSSRRKDLLERFIEAQDENKFTPKDLMDESFTMIIAGYETSGITESFLLVILGCLPHIQEKVMEELNEIYGNTSRSIDVEDLPKMKYLERVILETLRLFPVAPVVIRNITTDFKYGNHTIPAGCSCSIDIYKINRRKKLWGENAEEFDPDRFLPENSKNRHPYSFVAFGEGPRICIGKRYAIMSMKVVIATILRKFKISSTLDYKNMELKFHIFLYIKNGFMISLERREDN